MRSIKEPSQIATATTALKAAKAVFNEIKPEDEIPFYEDFVKDIGELESMNGPLTYHSDLRNRLVTFITKNYIPASQRLRISCPYVPDAWVPW